MLKQKDNFLIYFGVAFLCIGLIQFRYEISNITITALSISSLLISISQLIRPSSSLDIKSFNIIEYVNQNTEISTDMLLLSSVENELDNLTKEENELEKTKLIISSLLEATAVISFMIIMVFQPKIFNSTSVANIASTVSFGLIFISLWGNNQRKVSSQSKSYMDVIKSLVAALKHVIVRYNNHLSQSNERNSKSNDMFIDVNKLLQEVIPQLDKTKEENKNE